MQLHALRRDGELYACRPETEANRSWNVSAGLRSCFESGFISGFLYWIIKATARVLKIAFYCCYSRDVVYGIHSNELYITDKKKQVVKPSFSQTLRAVLAI